MTRKISKSVAIILAFHMLLVSGLYQSVSAAMIGTELILETEANSGPRDTLASFLARKEIQAALISQGIDLQEARNRMDHLSDDEIAQWADAIDQMRAGGGFLETFIVILFLVFIILLLTDITGHTDVFPFVREQAPNSAARRETAPATAAVKEPGPSLQDNGINPADLLIIYFKPDSNDLSARAFETLDQVVGFMDRHANTKIDITGFSDSDGASSYNLMLSESRANAVKSYLIARGIDPKKISSLGMGTQGFLPTSGTEEDSQMIGGVAIEFNLPATK